MKPLQIGLLVLVGAVGGAVIMKMTQPPQPASLPEPTASVAPTPASPAVATPEPPKPAPMPAPKPAPVFRPVRITRPPVTTVAQSRPPVMPQPQPAAPPPAPEPVEPLPVAAAPAEPEPAPEPAPEPVEAAPSVTLRAGMLLPVRLGEMLSSEHNLSGDTFTATLDAPLVADGFVIAERGAHLEGRVVEAGKSGAVKGGGALGIELTRLHTSDGQRVTIQTEVFRKQASSSTGEDIGLVAAAAGIGAAIGGIAGGGKGAGIGAAIGGVAGAGGVAATRRKPATLASESRISFRLRVPVTITERLDR